MFGVISVVFFTLTTPNMAMSFVVSYYGTFDGEAFHRVIGTLQPIQYALYTMSHFNCCVNPFIYARMQRSLKRYFTSGVIMFRMVTGRAGQFSPRVVRGDVYSVQFVSGIRGRIREGVN